LVPKGRDVLEPTLDSHQPEFRSFLRFCHDKSILVTIAWMKDLRLSRDIPLDYRLQVAELQATTRKWRQELGKVRDHQIGWRISPQGHSIGTILLHMADVEAFWVEQFVLGIERDPAELRELLSEETEQYAGRWPDPPLRPLDWFYEWQDRVRERTLEAVTRFGPSEVGVEREGLPSLTPRWVLHHVSHHEAYHAGQLVMLKSLAPKRAT
jgi:uncharacterized damage-inducible protein DinB